MTEFELMVDLHLGSERQGPGSTEDTLRALSFVELPSDQKLQIADIGSGNGGPTITLAQTLNAHIYAVDFLPLFLSELNSKAEEKGLSEKIKTIEAPMDALPFENEQLDMIWSEGSIYNMGFENGVRYWKNFLKSGGYLVASEITWITHERPSEIEEFWNEAYPEIDIASSKINILENHGFTLAGYFYLSPESWIRNYYKPQIKRFDHFLKKHDHSEKAKFVVKEHQNEIDLYYKFKDYYSYGFYVAKKS